MRLARVRRAEFARRRAEDQGGVRPPASFYLCDSISCVRPQITRAAPMCAYSFAAAGFTVSTTSGLMRSMV